MARAAIRIVPWRRAAIHQLTLRSTPRPSLGHREGPEANVECTDVCPHEAHLLLAGPDNLLAIAERGLQRESIGDRRKDLGHACIWVGAEEGHPPLRLVHQHHANQTAGRPPGRQERLVSLLHLLAVELEVLGHPAATLPSTLGQIDAVLPVDPRPATL